MQRLREAGAPLVVITLGSDGAIAGGRGTLTLTLTLTQTQTLKVLRAEQDHRRALPGGQVQQEVQAGVVTTEAASRRSYLCVSLRPRCLR